MSSTRYVTPSMAPRAGEGRVFRYSQWLPRRTTGGLWPAFTKVRWPVLTLSSPAQAVTKVQDELPSQSASFASVNTCASGLPVCAALLMSVFACIMNIAAGTPLPLTSATITSTRPCAVK